MGYPTVGVQRTQSKANNSTCSLEVVIQLSLTWFLSLPEAHCPGVQCWRFKDDPDTAYCAALSRQCASVENRAKSMARPACVPRRVPICRCPLEPRIRALEPFTLRPPVSNSVVVVRGDPILASFTAGLRPSVARQGRAIFFGLGRTERDRGCCPGFP
jgi:hypothetical protein